MVDAFDPRPEIAKRSNAAQAVFDAEVKKLWELYDIPDCFGGWGRGPENTSWPAGYMEDVNRVYARVMSTSAIDETEILLNDARRCLMFCYSLSVGLCGPADTARLLNLVDIFKFTASDQNIPDRPEAPTPDEVTPQTAWRYFDSLIACLEPQIKTLRSDAQRAIAAAAPNEMTVTFHLDDLPDLYRAIIHTIKTSSKPLCTQEDIAANTIYRDASPTFRTACALLKAMNIIDKDGRRYVLKMSGQMSE